ncbi:hypothetical protein Mgra_00001945 [Meloidogyne graminicola]|uniref:Uncharacterized protein n=1 Tax=Meloidogyne graminicola TaxID=189291 RepID=A0A8S9ZY76_9BILA|nr:hypothetical protein Mgra_00001945 [Meloidogyne graminicola]
MLLLKMEMFQANDYSIKGKIYKIFIQIIFYLLFFMLLSTVAELKAWPSGSMLGCCTGLVISVLKSEKKSSIICACGSGGRFVVTAFHASEKAKAILKLCGYGKIIKFDCLKVQKYDASRFDGQKFYNTPFGFEFVIQNATLSCILSAPFVSIGSLLCAVVGDSKNNRADLHLSVVSKTKEVKDLIRGDVIHIKRCFAMIDDECIVLKADEDDVSNRFLKTNVNLNSFLFVFLS